MILGFGVGLTIINKKDYKQSIKPEPSPETVKCEECKCLIEKNDAHKVVNSGHYLNLSSYIMYDDKLVYGDKYYCISHKKPYTRTLYDRYFSAEVEVTRSGEPIGYIKAPEKKKRRRPRKI